MQNIIVKQIANETSIVSPFKVIVLIFLSISNFPIIKEIVVIVK